MTTAQFLMLLFGIPLVNLGYLLIIMLVVGQEEKPHDQPLPRAFYMSKDLHD